MLFYAALALLCLPTAIYADNYITSLNSNNNSNPNPSLPPRWHQLEGYTFEQYVHDFKIDMTSSHPEWSIRKSLFMAELTRVRAHNNKNLSWKEGVNKFSYLTHNEKKSMLGRSKGAHQNHKPNHRIEADLSQLSTPTDQLPSRVDWRESYIMTAVKDQGYCGSCWAFASTAVIESHVAKETGLLYDLSVQQMAACAPNPDSCGGTGGCYGSTAELAFDYVAGSSGLLEEFQYGYTAYYGTTGSCLTSSSTPSATITGYVQLPTNNNTALINAVSKIGPIAVSVDASSWSAYESGIYDGCDQSSPDIDHAVVLAGYGEDNGSKYWLIRNSWSPAWGEYGYIRLARPASEYCGIDVTPQNGVACAGDTDPVKVCGTCGVTFDSAYPIGAKLV